MRTSVLLTASFLLGAIGLFAADETDPKFTTMKDLIAAIKAHQGKVVVVDFWADY
jgi:calcineurin-like phosphoesterase